MAENKNKIVLHCCGGTGISLSDKAIKDYTQLGETLPKYEFNYIDTSDANIKKIEKLGDFWQIKSKAFDGGDIRGSGGERAANVADILPNAAEYLNERGYVRKVPGEYHLVVCSASGGSGSTISAAILQQLLQRDIPTLLVVIGDSSSGLLAINTKNSLATYNSIALKLKKAVGIIYVNNFRANGDAGKSLASNEAAADANIKTQIGVLSVFLSSEVEDLDAEDMVNIIDQSNYKTIDIFPGLYGVGFYSKNVTIPPKSIPTVARSLTHRDAEYDTGLQLLHHKRGYLSNEEMLSGMGITEQLPLHWVMYANFLESESDNLDAEVDKFYGVMDNIKQKHVEGTSRSKSDSKTGFIF